MKYSETEIIKHLEIEIDSAEHINMHYGNCINTEIIKENIALINRQQTEIRLLKAEKEELLKQLEGGINIAREKFENCMIDHCYAEAQLEQRTIDALSNVINLIKNGGK